MTSSGSSATKVTPSGAATAESCRVSLISIAETSATMRSGISVGSASTVISRVTCSSTPPPLTPGAASAPSSSIATSAWIASSRLHLLQVDVLEAAAHRVQLLLLDHDRDGFAALDLEVEERGALAEHVAHLAFGDLEGASPPSRRE